MPFGPALIGQVFGRLTVISAAEVVIRSNGKSLSASLCKCVCGNTITVLNNSLKSNRTKSCGCLASENAINLLDRAHRARLKLDSSIASAQGVFQYYRDGDLDFYNDFLPLTQRNCFYCNITPSQITNMWLNKPNSYAYKDGTGDFIYNGLDRIDSTLPHIKSNILTCCKTCNFAKGKLSIDSFRQYIFRLINHIPIDMNHHRQLSKDINTSKLYDTSIYSYGSSVKRAMRWHYDDGDLTLEQFYQLSQLPCYYCGVYNFNNFNSSNRPESSQFARDNGMFSYNGLDRVNNQEGHNYNNVVASCITCNIAKNTSSLEDFYIWINRMREHYSMWEIVTESYIEV